MRRRLVREKWPQGDYYVNLGLPSGVMWASRNLDSTTSSGFASSTTASGSYYSWGNRGGHDNTYSFTTDSYSGTMGSNLTGNIPNDDVLYDAALYELGSPWRMPTRAEWLELIKNCTFSDKSTYVRFTSNINGRYINIPKAGYCREYGHLQDGVAANYWSSTYYNADKAYSFYCTDGAPGTDDIYKDTRYYGMPIRPVRSYN